MNQILHRRTAGEWGQGNEEQRTKGFSFPCLHSLAILFFAASLHAAPPRAELVSVQKIWDRAPHNGFTDLIRFRGQFFCCFREGLDHVGGDGVIRILASADGEHWADQAGVSEEGVDLRESKLAAAETHVVLLRMTATSLDPILKLPSGGFFDLVADPNEKTDLTASTDTEIAAAHARLRATLKSLPPDAPLPFEPQSVASRRYRDDKAAGRSTYLKRP